MVFSIVAVEDPLTGDLVQSDNFTSPHPSTFDITLPDDKAGEYLGAPGGPWIVSDLTDASGNVTIKFQQPLLSGGQDVVVSVMGVAIEAVPPIGHAGTVYDAISLFSLTPLMLEDAAQLSLEF